MGDEKKRPLMPGETCSPPVLDQRRIVLGHGSGGKMTQDLVEKLFLPNFSNDYLAPLDDQAVVEVNGSRLAFTTDSFVVTPIFFPGGDIGRLAINGTVNDIVMSGATPRFIAAAFILEEGLVTDDLVLVVKSMRKAAQEAGVLLVTGDTKVVNRGKGDQVFITTTGLGVLERQIRISADQARPGDRILLSGTIGDHGMAIMSRREGLEFEGPIESDTAALHTLVASMLDTSERIHCLRDPTRGGVATALNEIASRSQVGMELDGRSIPMRESVKGACEILGLDPLYVANEGKLVAIVAPEVADAMLDRMRSHPLGGDACVIGHVVAAHPRRVLLKTEIGGSRVLDVMLGEALPRIC